MKKLKKIGSILMAAVMTMALSATAFAANNDGDIGGDGIAGNWSSQDTPIVQSAGTVKLYKELTFYNPESVSVNAPSITYTYTVSSGSEGREIFDSESNHATGAAAHAITKAGILSGVNVNGSGEASGIVSFSPNDDPYAASVNGTKQTKPISIDFSKVTCTGAGVYRYKITETASAYNSSGVVEGSAGHIRYLDVYVKDGASEGAYEIYGFVCFINDNSIDGRANPALATPAAAEKTEGFVAIPDPDGDPSTNDGITADEYYTFNLKIEKKLVGDQAMNNHEFPFSLDFVNNTVTGDVLPIVSGTGTVPTLTAGDINGMDQNGTYLKLANGKTAIFEGIPVGTTVTINEMNDVTGTIYTVSTEGGTTNQTAGMSVNWNSWTDKVENWTAVTALQKTADDNTVKAEKNMTVLFTNTLLQISPTGVALRVAPYVLMMAAGAVLLLFARRFRRAEAEG